MCHFQALTQLSVGTVRCVRKILHVHQMKRNRSILFMKNMRWSILFPRVWDRNWTNVLYFQKFLFFHVVMSSTACAYVWLRCSSVILLAPYVLACCDFFILHSLNIPVVFLIQNIPPIWFDVDCVEQ